MTTTKIVQSGVLELLALCEKNLVKCDQAFIKRAFEYASIAHSDESRQSSEPYMTHPLAVAKILAEEIPFDDVSIVCALLHDVVENNKDYTIEMIRKTFGPEVSLIVDGLTKVQNLFKGTDIDQSENYRKLLMSITKDVRVMIVKFADRLHNMRTLEFLPPDKRKRIAQETLEIYAPLAHRFGLGKVKWELEDLSFKELNRQAYDNLKRKINAKRNEREDFIGELIRPLEEKLKETNYKFDISGRAKHLYSIYRKMIKRNKPFEEIYDLFAVRIIVDSDDPYSCYAVLGIVNGSYNPIQERFKDYIAIPKANNYQSLHTTVYGPSGRPVEVQIRTRKMHEISEQGVAAHWRYKEGSSGKDAAIDQYVNWIRELLDNSGGDELRKNIIENFRLNLYTQEIFIFTPKGELKRLPVNSTPVDFAFSIHSAVGFHCIGAKVNGRIVPLDTVLHSGDQVEVITSKNQNPNRNWLKFVQTHKAKQDIKKWLNKEEDDVIKKGRDIWEKKLRKLRLTFSNEELTIFVHEHKYDNIRQFFKETGMGKVDVEELLRATNEKEKKTKEFAIEFSEFNNMARSSGGSLLVDGSSTNMLHTYAKCCNPIPGDAAIGYITLGEGVKIHRKSCKTLAGLTKEPPEKFVDIKWPQTESSTFIVGLYVFGSDSPGILNDVAQAIVTYQNTNIKAINIDTNDSFFEGIVTLFVRDLEHLSRIIDRLKRIKGMSKVSRMEITT